MRLTLLMITSTLLLWGCSADSYPGKSTAASPVTIHVTGDIQAGGIVHP